MVRIEIKTEGAAFANEVGEYTNHSRNMEVARILRNLVNQINESSDANWSKVILVDQNGNVVGKYETL